MPLKFTFTHISELFFPRLCIVCGEKLISQEEYLCLACQFRIPRTNFHRQVGNMMEQLFYGRVPIERATAFFEFQKGSDYQKILHQLKYNGLNTLGEAIGNLFAAELINSDFIRPIELICPVPLHPKKERQRGYNQSYHLALGLAKHLNIPLGGSSIQRIIHTKTQTKKTRFERWQNVEGIFSVSDPDELKGKHILLVDDVVTTGATLEACVSAIHEQCSTKVSLLTLAIA